MKRKLQAVRPMARRAGSRERKAYFWEGGRGGGKITTDWKQLHALDKRWWGPNITPASLYLRWLDWKVGRKMSLGYVGGKDHQ